MDFIHNYLLHFKQLGDDLNNHENTTEIYGKEITKETPTNVTADNVHQIKNENGKNGNNISTNLLPVIYSYRGETLPTHPRIPRKTPRRRTRLNKQQLRQRRNKHGTRVFLLKPARYLLPPLVTHRIEDIPALSYATVEPTFSTGKNNSRNRLQFNEDRSLDDRQILNSTFSRKVFIPPPLRYLLPPLYNENDFEYQSSTTENSPPITTLNNKTYDLNSVREDVEQYHNQPELQDQSKKNHNVFRIVEPNIERLQEESTSTISPTQEDTIYTLSEDYTTKGYNFPQSEAYINYENPVDKEYPENRYSAENPITGFENFPNTTIEERNLNIDRNSNRPKAYPNQSITSDSRGIYVTSQDITPYQNETTTSFPFITGRNIEKELFESGQFQHLNATTEPTIENHNDFKLSMFNKPLLSAEVEKAGMKIVISNQNSTPVKKWEDVRHSSRGRYKYNHFNQFRFDNSNDRAITTSRPISVETKGRGRSLQLSVAETNYYNKRRISKQQELDQRGKAMIINGEL